MTHIYRLIVGLGILITSMSPLWLSYLLDNVIPFYIGLGILFSMGAYIIGSCFITD